MLPIRVKVFSANKVFKCFTFLFISSLGTEYLPRFLYKPKSNFHCSIFLHFSFINSFDILPCSTALSIALIALSVFSGISIISTPLNTAKTSASPSP